jgi:hypothetical protein
MMLSLGNNIFHVTDSYKGRVITNPCCSVLADLDLQQERQLNDTDPGPDDLEQTAIGGHRILRLLSRKRCQRTHGGEPVL